MNKIVFLGPKFEPPTGGVASVLAEYKKIFPKAYFVSTTNSKNKLTKIVTPILGLFQFIFKLALHPNIKIVHIHGASRSSFMRKFIFFRIAKLFHKKVIYHIHGAEYQLFYEKASKWQKNLIKTFINNSDCIVCLSESWKDFFNTTFAPRKIEIIPNIIEAPQEYTSKNSINKISNKLKFLFLGYIDERKGAWFLLEVLREHKEKLRGKVVFNVGGDGQVKKFQQLVSDYELNDIVKYIGWVSGVDKIKHFIDSDIYILPSYNEGLPISILEAMSYSLPIISTTVGGIPEIVSSDNGLLIEPGNKKQLWAAIESFLQSENTQLEKMGAASHAKVQQHLPGAVMSRLNRLYESLMRN